MKSGKKLICLLLVFALNLNVLDCSVLGSQFKNTFAEAVSGEQLVSGFLIAYSMPLKIIEGLCKSDTLDDSSTEQNKTKSDEGTPREGTYLIMPSMHGSELLKQQFGKKAVNSGVQLIGQIFNNISDFNISSIIKRKTKLILFFTPQFLKYMIALSLQNMPDAIYYYFGKNINSPAQKWSGFLFSEALL